MHKVERSFEYMSMRTNRHRTLIFPLGASTVRTTEIAYVHPRAPLGRAMTAEDHYIRPVPGYTTEYEAAYKWPIEHRLRDRDRHSLPPAARPVGSCE